MLTALALFLVYRFESFRFKVSHATMHTVQGTMDMLDMHQTAALPPIAFPLMSFSTYSEVYQRLQLYLSSNTLVIT
jgi:hypothetical protein